jgi:hypothetical protein
LKLIEAPHRQSRRAFLKWTGKGMLLSALSPFVPRLNAASSKNSLFWIKDIPSQPFVWRMGENYHLGIECLLRLMAVNGKKFYQSDRHSALCSPAGLIGPEDVVLIKVNAQWKYRGCTNSDLVRGLIQRILNHPDGFTGEVVIFENGQGRGSLHCDTVGAWRNPYPDAEVHANAEDESHSFMYLVEKVFDDDRVSSCLLDPIRKTFIGDSDHVTDGYRMYENVSYPCFTTTGGNRIELREGIWDGMGHKNNLKLINVPVLKKHDRDGSEITAALKNFYGILSMADGYAKYRHFEGLGETCGKMICSVRAPVLNILDAIWVSHKTLRGYPMDRSVRVNQILASQDPVALDYWAAKYIMYPIDANVRHLPDFPVIHHWLAEARDVINQRGGLYNPEKRIFVDKTTLDESEMSVREYSVFLYIKEWIEQSKKEQWNRRRWIR